MKKVIKEVKMTFDPLVNWLNEDVLGSVAAARWCSDTEDVLGWGGGGHSRWCSGTEDVLGWGGGGAAGGVLAMRMCWDGATAR